MNWKECARLLDTAVDRSRFEWPTGWGFDCEPNTFTINDIWGAISWIWTWPGDWLLSRPGLQSFLDGAVQGTVVGSVASTVIGWLIFWLFLLVASQD